MNNRDLNNRLLYYFRCIGDFAHKHGLTNAEAYKFLADYKGLDFIIDHYETEHTQSIEDSIDDMMIVCRRNGGLLN